MYLSEKHFRMMERIGRSLCVCGSKVKSRGDFVKKEVGRKKRGELVLFEGSCTSPKTIFT